MAMTTLASKKMTSLGKIPVFLATVLLILGISSMASAAFNVTKYQVNTDSGFTITDFQQDPDRVYPGDQVKLQMSFETLKQSASEVIVTISIPFQSGSSLTNFGELKKGEPQQISREFTVPIGTKPGTYTVYVYAKESNTGQQEVALIPLTVKEPLISNLLIAKTNFKDSIKTGDSAQVNLQISNTGVIEANDVTVEIVTNKSSPFTPLEFDRVFLSKIEAGKTATIPFNVGVAADAAPGFYSLTINLHYSADNVEQPNLEQKLGLKVDSVSQLFVTSDVTPNTAQGGMTLTLTIANVGNTAVRGVYIKASSDSMRIQGSSDKFIGTLNLDDSSTMTLNVMPAQGRQGESLVKVSLSYKDPLNQEHNVDQVVPVTLNDVGGFALNSTGGTQRFTRQQAQGGNFFGFSLIQWAVGLIIVVGAFIAFKWYKGRRKS